MFAYCHNNPLKYVDPSGCVIVLSSDATKEQTEAYDKAVAYIKTSHTGKELVEMLEASDVTFTIVFIDDNDMRYNPTDNVIYFDTNSGLIMKDGTSVQSAALGLAHEMGHAAQDLTGVLSNCMGTEFMVEPFNLRDYETPIAKELGEPVREKYWDETGHMDMNNPTHHRTTYIRPWLHYLLPWNWFKPRVTVTDHNLLD